MICPGCGAEYVDGIDRCRDCDVDLVDEVLRGSGEARRRPRAAEAAATPSAAAGVRVVVLARFTNEIEARIACSALQSAGIPATVRKDDEGGFNPGLAFTRGVDLLVREDDAAEALSILASST